MANGEWRMASGEWRMASGVASLRAGATQSSWWLARGEQVGGWERRGDHQLDRFAFVVQNDSQDRFAAFRRTRLTAMTGRGASLRACEAIQLVVQEEAGLPRRFAPRNDGEGWASGEWRMANGEWRVASGGRHCELAKQYSWWCRKSLDCRVASLLAMTGRGERVGGWRVASGEWRVGGVIASLRSNPVDGWRGVSRLGGGRELACISWIASRSLFKTIHRIVLPPFGGHASPR